MEIEVDGLEKKHNPNRVKVAIRVRPMISREQINHDLPCVEIDSHHEIVIGTNRSFKFDRVFKENSLQEEVYQECVKELILGCFEGYNAAVLAYGQTGSGKTYTMGTSTATMDRTEEGIIPRVIYDIFSEIDKRKHQSEFHIRASFLEIYNEQIIDLLEEEKNIKNKDSSVTIREEKDGSVSIYGATEEKVYDSTHLLNLLDRGSLHRTTATTMMNESSSRSHAIFTIFIEQHSKHQEELAEEGFITAKFYFVDLAGSERVKKTGATGITLKEGININLGLLELGNVISALAVEKKESQFITYRNSKLTRILQDSLGGNSNTYMIACISPSESNYEESLNTLKYASKAMNIKNKPVINRDPHSALLNQLKQKILSLQTQNHNLKKLLSQNGVLFHEDQIKHQPNPPHDQFRSLTLKYNILEKKYQKLFLELKDQKKRKNQLEITAYNLQRDIDIAKALIEEIKRNHPEIHIDEDELHEKQRVSLIEDYLNKIQNMQAEILEKQKITTQLQIQYAKLHEFSQRDELILIKNNEKLYNLKNENKDLKKSNCELKRQIKRWRQSKMVSEGEQNQNNKSYDCNEVISQELDEEEEENIDEDDILSSDSSFHEEVEAFAKNENSIKTEIKNMEQSIQEKENMLQIITNQQMDMEYKLIEEMKEEYHQKIFELEKEKNQLIKQQRAEINQTTANKSTHKIQLLEVQLREYRKKVKEQKNLEKKVSTQNTTIKSLADQIKLFKVQKIELNRKLKEDKDKFEKFKAKRMMQLIISKKENLQKDVQIKKLTNQNKKKTLFVLKRTDELKRVRKVNEALKKLNKPMRQSIQAQITSKSYNNEEIDMENEQYDKLMQVALKNILLRVDRNYDLQKYSKKCDEISQELEALVKDEGCLTLKLDRLKLKEQNEDYAELQARFIEERAREGSELKMNINYLRERINNLQESLEFCQGKYEQILIDSQQKYAYNYQNQIIFNKKYDTLQALRAFLKSSFKTIEKVVHQNYKVRSEDQDNLMKISSLSSEIEELKQNMQRITTQNQQQISRIREEMMFRQYQCSMEQQNNENEMNQNKSAQVQQNNKIWEREKKNYERKIFELGKINGKLSSDVEIWRRKCIIVQEKYQSMRNLFNKDKFIGRPIKEEENIITNHSFYPKDRTKFTFNNAPNTLNNPPNTLNNAPTNRPFNFNAPTNNLQMTASNRAKDNTQVLLEEINTMAEQLKSGQARQKRNFNEEHSDDERREVNAYYSQKMEINKNKWECITTIDAHSSPVLAIENYNNYLISTATRNVRIWDLQTHKLESDIIGPSIPSFVKSVVVFKEKQLMATACDKNITLWDLRSLNTEGVLRGHRDQIRSLHIVGNYLFSAGKGLPNCGSLLVWDLRYLNFNSPMQEKQKNQDIFSMTSHKKTLYYGTRDHHVRRLNIDSMETLPAFQPPHMDTVTGLATCKDYLISGSKDKNLRLWSLDTSIYNLKSTTHIFNDYVNTVRSDSYIPIFYAGDRTGQVKVATVYKERVELLGIFSHTQSVNTICSLEANKGVVSTGSSDKTIKLWQPNHETLHHIESYF